VLKAVRARANLAGGDGRAGKMGVRANRCGGSDIRSLVFAPRCSLFGDFRF